MKTILKMEIKEHGQEHPDYFQGCGVAFTEFEDCFTGIGETSYAALEDALEQAAQFYNVESIVNTLDCYQKNVGGEMFFHTSILMK